MKVKRKNSPTYVISLNEEEALKLYNYLSNSMSEDDELDVFSIELSAELEELLEDKAIL